MAYQINKHNQNLGSILISFVFKAVIYMVVLLFTLPFWFFGQLVKSLFTSGQEFDWSKTLKQAITKVKRIFFETDKKSVIEDIPFEEVKQPDKQTQKTEPKPKMATESTEASKFITDLYKWQHEVESETMKHDIQQIIEISVVISKRDNEASKRFFYRYADTLNRMLKRYDEIENTRIKSQEFLNAMAQTEQAVSKIAVAFEKELSHMYKADILDMNAETAAFLQDLRNRGLIDDEQTK